MLLKYTSHKTHSRSYFAGFIDAYYYSKKKKFHSLSLKCSNLKTTVIFALKQLSRPFFFAALTFDSLKKIQSHICYNTTH